MKENTVIRRWIEEEGLQSISRKLGYSKALISHWGTGRRKLNAEHAVLIEWVTQGKITRQQLLPDIFGPLQYDDPRPRSASVPPADV